MTDKQERKNSLSSEILLVFAAIKNDEWNKSMTKLLSNNTRLLETIDLQTGMTPLLSACFYNREKIIAELIDINANVNAIVQKTHKESCLQLSSQFEGSAVRNLLCASADVNYLDNHKQTALIGAVHNGILPNVKDLLEANANPNAGSHSALYRSTKAPKDKISCTTQIRNQINQILLFSNSIGTGVIMLSLEGLGLTDLPQDSEYWRTFANLTSLDLSHNNLEFLPIELARLPSLRTVELEGNPLSALPRSCRSWSWDLRSYLTSIHEDAEDFLERKLILVGSEGVGKTTLLECIKSSTGRSTCSNNISTNGISVQSKFSVHREAGTFQMLNPWRLLWQPTEKIFKFSAWDFGGQEVFYPSHQFFLTSQSIYLVVFDLRDPLYERIDYWMNQLKSTVPQDKVSPILIIGTHLDAVQDDPDESYINKIMEQLKIRFPRQRFPGMQGIHIVSCRTGEGVFELKENLERQAERIKILAAPSWIAFQKLLQQKQQKKTKLSKTRDYLHWKTFLKYAGKCLIKKNELLDVIEFLKDTGSILHFDDKKSNLKDLVVLNPSWLAGIMSSFVTFYNKWHQEGLITRENIAHILKGYKVSHATLLALLEKFGILVRLPATDNNYTHVLVPSLLPVESPRNFYNPEPLASHESSLQRVWSHRFPSETIEHSRIYEFGFLPLGCFERVLAGTFFMQIGGILHLNFWRNGVLLSLEDHPTHCCLIKFQHKRQTKAGSTVYSLSIQARMPVSEFITGVPNVLLGEIVQLVEHIVSCYFSRLSNKMRRYIPCLHCKQQNSFSEPYWFSYEECVRKLTSNDPIVYCHGFRVPQRAVLISQLAPDISFRGFTILDENTIGDPNEWKFLAKGGFGIVYKGYVNGKAVAIKELLNSETKVLESYNEFQKEVQIMSVLRHPNTVDLIGITTNPLRIVTEFIGGGDLNKLLRPDGISNNNSLGWPLRYRLSYDIAQGMNYLQSFTPPIVHRDLRSPNIFIESTELTAPVCAKVADFGLSAFVAPNVAGALQTWQWLAPEVLDPRSTSYCERSDIYSFGIVLWEILTSAMPFQEYEKDPRFSRTRKDTDGSIVFDTDFLKIKNSIVTENLRPTIPSYCDSVFYEIIKSCWNADPMQRMKFSEILRLLEGFVEPSVVDDYTHHDNDENVAILTVLESSELINSKITNNDEALLHSIHLSEENLRIPPLQEISLTNEVHQILIVFPKLWVASEGIIHIFDISDINLNSFSQENLLTSWVAHESRIYSMILVDHISFAEVWTGGEDGKIAVWNPKSGELIWHTELNYMISDLLEVSHNEMKTIWAAVVEENSIYIFNSGNFELVTRISLPNNSTCFGICLHHQYVLVGSIDKILIFDSSGEQIGEWLAHKGAIRYIHSPMDGNYQIWSAAGNVLCVWELSVDDLLTLKKLKEIIAHDTRITAMKFLQVPRLADDDSGNFTVEKEVWTSSYDYNCLFWDSRHFHPYYELKLPKSKELVRCFAQYHSQVFLGSSYRDGDATRGNLYFYNFDNVLVDNSGVTPSIPT